MHFLLIFYFALRLLQHGDIERNPGPKYFSICHWNLNSLTGHNYLKVSQILAFNLVRKFDILCVSETHLDFSVSKDDNALSIEGYSILRADNPDKISVRQMSNINLPECSKKEKVCDYLVWLSRSKSK